MKSYETLHTISDMHDTNSSLKDEIDELNWLVHEQKKEIRRLKEQQIKDAGVDLINIGRGIKNDRRQLFTKRD